MMDALLLKACADQYLAGLHRDAEHARLVREAKCHREANRRRAVPPAHAQPRWWRRRRPIAAI